MVLRRDTRALLQPRGGIGGVHANACMFGPGVWHNLGAPSPASGFMLRGRSGCGWIAVLPSPLPRGPVLRERGVYKSNGAPSSSVAEKSNLHSPASVSVLVSACVSAPLASEAWRAVVLLVWEQETGGGRRGSGYWRSLTL